jgi:catechol 2,3-dioxygenase-like lactoylglutathione lyase family enzyme
VIELRRIDHACLRVDSLDEAAPRWAIQFGLTERGRHGDRALLACDYDAYSLELLESGGPGHDHTGFELGRACSIADARAHLEACAVAFEERDGSLFLEDPDGNGIELMQNRGRETLWPPVGRRTTTNPGFHPRKLGHVNCLTGQIQEQARFYTEVLGMRVTDWLGGDGAWFHVNADHHVMALVNKGYPHFHHFALDMIDWGQLRVAFDHLGQHGRWLGWGPLRHNLGQNLCGYVRIPEEHCFVELYCDMEQLERDHEPRYFPDDPHASNVWGILPPRSYFRFDEAAVASERHQLEALGTPLPPLVKENA